MAGTSTLKRPTITPMWRMYTRNASLLFSNQGSGGDVELSIEAAIADVEFWMGDPVVGLFPFFS